MALTKKEKQQFDDLETQVNLLKAWKLTEPVERDVPIPQGWDEVAFGWDFNSYEFGRVYETWSKTVRHGTGHEAQDVCNGSRGGLTQFSTKELALRALRYELEQKYMKRLAEIDEEILRCQA